MTRPIPNILAALAVAAAAVLVLMPPPEGLPREATQAAGLCLGAIGLWATGALPEYLTSVIFLLLAIVLAVAGPEVVFSGFGASAWWLVFGGLVIGIAVKKTGLGERLARSLLRVFGGSYLRVLIGIAVVATVMNFLIPSTMVRVVMLVPLVALMAGRMGYAEGSGARNGLILATALLSFSPGAAILPSIVVNMVWAGTVESLFGQTVTYGRYFVLHFPVIGAVKTVLIVATVWLMFRAPAEHEGEISGGGDVTGAERQLALVLALALALWVTDFWHGVSPAWVATGAAVLLLLPRVGLLTHEDFEGGLKVAPLLFVAAVLGLGRIVAETGLGGAMGGVLLDVFAFEQGRPFLNFYQLTALYTVTGMVTTIPGMPAVVSPLAPEIAAATGLPLMTVLDMEVVAFSTLILPYQIPPMVVAMQLGGVRAVDGARLTLAVAAVTLVAVNPLIFVYWQALGMFG